MEPKQTQPIEVIAISKKATLKTIMEDIGNLPEKLMEDVANQSLETSGPMIFVYQGCTGDWEKPFDLQITQPVSKTQGYAGEYKAVKLAPFKCIERSYKGNFHDMGSKGYEPFIADAEKNGFTLSDQCREIYTAFVAPDSEDNITELQLGVV